MWEKLDKLDNEYYKKYTIMDIYDQIVDEYNRSNINTKIANKNDIERFKRTIKRNYDSLNKIGKMKAKSFLNRSKIGNNEILQFMIYMIYNIKQNKLDEYTNIMAEELVEDTYDKEIKELSKKLNKPIPKPPVFMGIITYVFFTINARGYIWRDYCDGTVDYNANETYRYLVVNGTKGLKELLEKQKRRIINKKKEPSKDKFSGALDEQMVFLMNTTKLEAYKKMKIEKCKFIAVVDDATTLMCKGLNNKVFLINGINEYDRWAGDKKENLVLTRFKTKGMKIGENLPPITNHIHNCRSTITYQIGE